MTGLELRKKRQKIGLTQQDLANQLSISHTTISRWERGKTGPNRLYSCTVREFFEKFEKGGYDPVLQALENAPFDDEPLTDEDINALEEAHQSVEEGRILSDEEFRRRLLE